MSLFTVQDLPFRRSHAELSDSVFVQCLSEEQRKDLDEWCSGAAVGERWCKGWLDEDCETHVVAVRRVA